MHKALCLTTMLAFCAGCADTLRNEGRAAGLLDAAEPRAKAHARALAGEDLGEMRRTGAALLAGLRCWWAPDCAEPPAVSDADG